MKIAIQFSLIFILNSSIGICNEQNLIQSICKITNDIINSNTDTKDVLIGNLGGKTWSLTINKIIECIDDGTAVVVTDLNKKMTTKDLRKAAVIIIAFKEPNEAQTIDLIRNQLGSTIFHHMAKIICLAPASSTPNQKFKVLLVLLDLGHLNIAFVYLSISGDVIYETIKSISMNQQFYKNPQDSSIIFPDKLKNVEKYAYKVPIYYQPPVVDVVNNRVSSPMLFFLEAIAKVQNAKVHLFLIENFMDIGKYWDNREMDLSINTVVSVQNEAQRLQTYEEKSYCALVPIPPSVTYFSIIFIKPFDVLIWLLFILSIISSVVVWRMFRGRGAVDSHWKLAVGIFTMFIGQGADFSRRNRFVLAFLLNIISLSVFLLSNLYEGEITSFMIEPPHDDRLKTFDDLINSKYPIISGSLFEYTIRNSSFAQKLSSRFNASGLFLEDEDAIKREMVFIRPCDEARATLNRKLLNGQYVSDYYYILNVKLLWQFLELEASFLNPFVDRLQYYLDLCFQAGLPYMWKIMAFQDDKKVTSTRIRSEKDYLELQDLISVFRLLLVGLGLSTLLLLFEIFCHDCCKNIDFQCKMNLRGWFTRKIHSQTKRSVKIRRIYVRPFQDV